MLSSDLPQPEAKFPPQPVGESLLYETIRGFAKDIQIKNFIERGCAVCGLLTAESQLRDISE
ncbi:hypothetical protein C8Q76DRAFT_632136, partial [Earliella scabrosa]